MMGVVQFQEIPSAMLSLPFPVTSLLGGLQKHNMILKLLGEHFFPGGFLHQSGGVVCDIDPPGQIRGRAI